MSQRAIAGYAIGGVLLLAGGVLFWLSPVIDAKVAKPTEWVAIGAVGMLFVLGGLLALVLAFFGDDER